MKRTLTLATAALIGLAIAVALFLTQQANGPNGVAQQDEENVVTASHNLPHSGIDEAPSQLVQSGPVDLPDQLPGSLDGTSEPSGWTRTDANNALIPTPELRELFEYYLAALGEETLEQLIARIQNALGTLPEPARSEAVETLGAYLDYKLALGELEATAPEAASLDADAMARQMAEVRALRRQWLDADTADAFFALEEAIDQFQVAQRQIRANESLSDKQKADRLQQAEELLPAPIRESRQQTRKFAEYQQVRQDLAGDPQALQAWREEAFGAEAAERLVQVEADQRDWEMRWQAYQKDKEDLGGLAGPERDAAVERLREQYFEGPERHRARALDSIQ